MTNWIHPRKAWARCRAQIGGASLAVLWCFLLVSSLPAAELQKLRDHLPAAAKRLTPAGRLDQKKELNLAIGLPVRDQGALDNFLKDLYDPASPNFHKFLTPAEFTTRFGPAEADYEAVVKFAKANGFTVTNRHPNRLILDVKGAASVVEKTFHVTLRTYQHPTEDRQFFAPDGEPSLDLAIPLLHISGLDNYWLPRPKLKEKPAAGQVGGAAAPNLGSAPGGSYAAGDFRAAYVPGTSLTGTGQSVGLLQFDGYYASDVAAYRTQFGLPNIPLVNVPIDGGVTTPGSGNSEVCLDIEMVMSMAPGVSTIYVYQAPNPSPWVDLLSRMANDNLAKQLSCSWGGGGANASAEVIFQQMAAQGQSFFNASGDSDAFTGSIPFPADSPNITQVGATTLTTTGAGGTYVSETVWNWGGGTGSCGGVSPTYSIPTWQQGVSMTANQGSTTMRNVPDVALTGDNVYVMYNNGGSGSFGGTSCAAPLWAAFTALVNQQAVTNGHLTVGFLNPTIYNIGTGSAYNSNFHDVTTGNNFSPTSLNKFAATTGYDLCTGLGSPSGAGLLFTLGGPFTPTITGFNPASGLASTSVTITGTNFYGVTNVAFNGTAASFTVNSPTQITATVPVGAASGFITVTTSGGTATSSTAFAVFGYSPAYGLPGSSVTFTGSGFTGATAVTFNGVGATFTVNSDTQVTATVPATATTGPISVTTPGGVISSSTSFAVLTGNGNPTIASFTPRSAAVGTNVTITGTNFVALSAVTFNGTPATFTVISPTQIAAIVPVPQGGLSGYVSVITSLGTATGTNIFTTLATLGVYNSATDLPVTSSTFSPSGTTVYFTLNFAPLAGTNLTVIRNTGMSFINGTFSNLVQGQAVVLSYGGVNYNFVANYYGGSGHDLVLQWANNRTLAWGLNVSGQIGNNSTSNSLVPVAVSTASPLLGKTIVAQASGANHTLALCSDGTLAAWGSNSSEQLGNNTTVSSLVPTAVVTAGTALAGKTVVAIAAGGSHNLALCSDGTVAAWGDNSYGELGNNSYAASGVPVAVTTSGVLSGKTAIAIAAGANFSVALCADGTIATWGVNSGGQLGNNSTSNAAVPVAVNTAGALSGKTVTAISAGTFRSMALCSDGTLVSWGSSYYGESGVSGVSISIVPVVVPASGALSGKTVTAIAGGEYHSLALCSDGTVASWGYNANGELGNGGTTQSSVPVTVKTTSTALAGKTVASISAGSYHSLALCGDGTLVTWGQNTYGQLGNNSSSDNTTAVTVATSALAAGERFVQVASGQAAYHSLGLVAASPNPQIGVQQTAGFALLNGAGTVNFGNSLVGASVQATLTILNTGSAPLAISSVGIDGANSADFAVTASPASSVSMGSSTALVLTFTPSAAFNRNATLHIGSNDPNTGTFNIGLVGTAQGAVAATYTSKADVPLTVTGGFTATGSSVNFTLSYAPTVGTNLTVVKNSGLSFINGVFSNLAQGQTVSLPFGGIVYKFVANYFGGGGRDLVLQWAYNRPIAWGLDTYGQLGNANSVNYLTPVGVTTTGVLSGKTVVAVASGQYHNLALCSDGTLAAWGYNSNGQLGNNSTTTSVVPVAVTIAGTPLAGKTIVAVSAGLAHSLALCSDGTVAAWGNNNYGQLGNNSTTQSTIPIAVNASGVLSGKQVTAITAGEWHSMALCSDGTVAAWGENNDGQLGNNSITNSSIPVAVSNVGTALAGKTPVGIGAGYDFSTALCSDGTMATWGYNIDGQLGNGTTANSLVPVAVTTAGTTLASKKVVAMATGQYHCLVACSDGTTAAWGYNGYGQLGNNSTTNSLVPVAVYTSGTPLAGRGVVAIAAGLYHSLALCSDGTLASWGYNNSGELGNKSVATSLVAVAVNTAGTVLAGKSVASLAVGYYHNVVLCSDGTLGAWGYGFYGQLGNNRPSNFTAPIAVNTAGTPLDGKTIVSQSAGAYHSVALCSDGTVATWGYNNDGQLGNGSSITIAVPAAIATVGTILAGKTVVAVAAGYYHNLALCSDGTLAAWGYNNYGQLGNNSTANSLVPTAVTTAGTPLAGRTVVAIAVGAYHCAVLCSDGTIVTWGNNTYGQLGNGTFTNSLVPIAVTTPGTPLAGKAATSIAAGAYHIVALCTDGTLALWGYDIYGQLGNGSTNNSVLPVAVTTSGVLSGKSVIALAPGGYHSLAVCTGGTLVSWGENNYGQLGINSSSNNSVPVAVSTAGVLSGKVVSGVASGLYYSLALCADGTATAWGYNGDGELGNGSTTNSNVPVTVSLASLASGELLTQLFGGQGAAHSLGIVAKPLSPQIQIQQPTGTNLVSGASGVNFGDSPVGTAVSVTFTILNGGTAPLTISATTIDGANGNEFSVTSAPASLVAAGASTTMSVTFNPASAFNRSAVLHVTSNDPNTATFNIGLSGNGIGTGTLSAVFNSANTVPLTTASVFAPTGSSVNLTLNYAPTPGTTLTVIKNTGLNFISGVFANLAQGQAVVLGYGGINYNFVANYYGGSGRDLVLQWANNRPVAWGLDNYGQLGNANPIKFLLPVAVTTTGVLSGKIVTAVAAGYGHSIAICSDGTLASWGENNLGQLGRGNSTNSNVPVAVTVTGTPLAGKNVVALWAGFYYSIALCSDGTLVAWGDNSYGQLGNNSTTNSTTAVAVNTSGLLSGKTVVSVAAGQSHTLALCSDGTLLAWGDNSYGQLGSNSILQSNVPVAVTVSGTPLAGKTITALAAGNNDSIALCSDGTICAWGSGTIGQLGNGTTGISSVPQAVTTTGTVLAGKTVVAVAAGYYHNLALCSDGTLATWGYNSNGQLGNNNTTLSLIPSAVATVGTVLAGKTVVAIAAGNYHSMALCSDGTMATWGYNIYGQLGNNSTTNSLVPVAVTTAGTPLSGKTVTAIAGGGYHSLVRCLDGTVIAWGYDYYGELGNNNPSNFPSPVAVSTAGTSVAGKTILSEVAGAYHSLALSSDGTVSAWGLNTFGQLGNGSSSNNSVPIAVANSGILAGKVVVAVAAGLYHSLALCSDGTLAAWGLNSFGQLGNNSTVQSNVPVAVTVAGTALAGKKVIAVAGGDYHSIALCSDGTVAAWGYNVYGQLGNNSTGNSSIAVAVSTAGTALAGKTVTAIGAGSGHNLALCSDGTLTAWGYNVYGQLGNNSTSQSSVAVSVVTAGDVLAGKIVSAIAVGLSHNLALCSDGTFAAWGYGYDGQLGVGSTANFSVPTAVGATGVLSGKTLAAIGAGGYHSLALCSDGAPIAFGYNADGELGNGSLANSLLPVTVSTASLAAGERFMLVTGGERASHSLGLIAGMPIPAVATSAATSIAGAGATLNGVVSANNNSTTVTFDYGTDVSYGKTATATPAPVTGTSATAVSATLSGLNAALTYHFRVRGVSAAGTTLGADMTFVTSNNNASLSGLVLGGATLSPSFSSSTTSYTIAVPNSTTSVTITPTLADGNATVAVNGTGLASGATSGAINLAVGDNSIRTVVTAQDGLTKVTYTVVVTRQSGLQDWRQTNFGTAANGGSAGDMFDYNGNGIPNLVKYAFGLDPVTPGASRLLPKPVLNGNTLSVTFTEPPGVGGITYGAEWTSAFGSSGWLPVPDTGLGTTHVFSISVGSAPAGFMRLKISDP